MKHDDPQPWQRPHIYETAGDGCVLCGQAEELGMWHVPHAAPIAHVYIPEKGAGGTCVCGQQRMSGLHVTDSGAPDIDTAAIHARLDELQTAVAAIRAILPPRQQP